MLKTVSSITNAIGALNYVGTWDASTNTPTLTSSVGTKGDYYQVSVAGSTNINGISNWGVGDVIAFNGATWQRIEGGADLNGVNLSFTGISSGASGSVGAPAYTFTGDTDTGFWRPGAGEVALSANGVESYRQAANGFHRFGGADVPTERVSGTSLAIQPGSASSRGNYRSRIFYSNYLGSGGNINICKIESNTASFAITGPSVKIKVFYTYYTGFTARNYAEYLIQPVYGAAPFVITLTTTGTVPTITVTQSGTEATIAVTHAGDVHFYAQAEVFGNPIEWYI
jgi:hypothetical protein